MRDIIITAIVFGFLPMVLSRPHVGLYLFSWLSYMNPHRLAWGFAVNMPFAYIVAITTLVSVVISKEPKQMPWTREMTVLLLYILWMTVTTYFAFFSNLAWDQLQKSSKSKS